MEAFVSLVTNDSYALGAIALGRSLRNTGTLRKLALLITHEVSQDMRRRLERLWDELILVEELDSGDSEHLALLTRPELGVTFSKIHAWRLTQYTKCVFLDADTIVLQNVDELFDREELSAAPDIGWPDCFNSGVFVFEPSLDTFRGLLNLARQRGSFDGGDQGLLNTFWSDWATRDIKYHLPFIYNVTPNITYGYAPAFQRFGHNIKIIHFIGATKPWQHHYKPEVDTVILFPGTYSSEHAAQDFIRRWWQLYTEAEQPDYQSFDWLSPSWGAPPSSSPTSSHHTPPPHTPFTTPHIITHTYHSNTSHPTIFVSTNNPSLKPIYDHSHSSHDIIHTYSPSFSQTHSPYYCYPSQTSDHSSTHSPCAPESEDKPKAPPTPAYLSLPYRDYHSHTSLSFHSPDELFGRVLDKLHVEPPTTDFSRDDFDDVEDFTASIYRGLDSFFDDDIVPPLRISYPYSTSCPDLHVGPPTSAYSSEAIDFPDSFTQSDFSYVPPNPYYYHSTLASQFDGLDNDTLVGKTDINDPSTEGDANSQLESTLSERSMSPVHYSLLDKEEEEIVGTVELSDSVLTKVNDSSSSTHALPPLSSLITTLTPSTPDTDQSLAREEEQLSQGAWQQTDTEKSVEQTNFEQGHIDFNGRDSFENIQAHIERMLNND